MAEVSAVKIPVYNFNDPALWFTICESTFQLGCPKPVTESKTKYNYIIAHLPPEATTIIRDVILNPDAADPYTHVKTELIKRSGESSQQQIRKLFVGEELGDRRPSELLRILKRRAESHNVSDELLLELFQAQLPSQVQSILAAISPLSLDKAAEVADRVMEVTPVPKNSSTNTGSSGTQKKLKGHAQNGVKSNSITPVESDLNSTQKENTFQLPKTKKNKKFWFRWQKPWSFCFEMPVSERSSQKDNNSPQAVIVQWNSLKDKSPDA